MCWHFGGSWGSRTAGCFSLNEDPPVTSSCFFCVCACECVCFVALPSMLLIRVGLHYDPPTCPERKMKLSPYFLIFLLPQRSAATASSTALRPAGTSCAVIQKCECECGWMNLGPFLIAKHCWEQKIDWLCVCEVCVCVCEGELMITV